MMLLRFGIGFVKELILVIMVNMGSLRLNWMEVKITKIRTL